MANGYGCLMTRSGFTLDSNWVAAEECGVAVAKDGFAGSAWAWIGASAS